MASDAGEKLRTGVGVCKDLSCQKSTCGEFDIVRYINILTWLRGFRDKRLFLVLFSLCPSLFRELRDKRNFKKLQF